MFASLVSIDRVKPVWKSTKKELLISENVHTRTESICWSILMYNSDEIVLLTL